MKASGAGLLGTLLGVAAASAIGGARPVHAAEFGLPAKPNIVFPLTDDQTTGTLGCYGNPDLHTPNLDKLPWE